jgi:insulysin
MSATRFILNACTMLRLALVASALVPLVLSSPAAAESIIKSPADTRSYQTLQLDNGLRVVLVSDPDSEVAAASLDVHVGSGDEPADRPGLAHFLEHMLFLGTRQFPESGEYHAYINANGGSRNAYTAYENTNYHFELEASALAGALDRFAAFFIAPLMDAAYVERERKAVHAEYTGRLSNDGPRTHAAFKQALNPEHPLSRFFVGNLETLADSDGDLVRDDLLAFYDQHYHAANMSLAVLGRESLEDLEVMVRERFSAIRGGVASPSPTQVPLFLPGALPALLEVKPHKDRRSVTLTFPTPPRRALYASKPDAYVANLLGHEGPGSLLSALRRAGLANGLSAGGGLSYDIESTFEVSVALTEGGLKRLDEVIAGVFSYVDLLRETGPESHRFDEQASLAATDFRFQERGDPGDLTRALAARAQEFPSADLLRLGYAYDRFDPDAISAILDALRPNNMLVMIVSADVNATLTAPYLDAPYRLSPLDAQAIEPWAARTLSAQLSLPPSNPFVAEDFELVDAGREEVLPVRIVDEPGFELWHAADTTFERPLASFYVSIRSPAANLTPRRAALTRVFVSMVNESLTEPLYPAVLAGLGVSVYPHLRGLSIRVHGYSDKHALAVEYAVAALNEPKLDKATFERVVESLRRSWANQALGSPYGRAMSELRNALLSPHWSAQQMLSATKQLTLDDVRRFVSELYAELDVVTLAHGNVSRADAEDIGKRVRALMLTGRKPVTVPRSRVMQLDTGNPRVMVVDLDNDDRAVVRYYQGQQRTHHARAATAMLSHLLSSRFFAQLRTEEQLGYVVFGTSMPLFDVPGLVYVVQSPNASASHIEERMDHFLSNAKSMLEAIDEGEFGRQREALLARLLERDSSLQARTNRYWNEMDRPGGKLDDRRKLADALRALKGPDVVTLFEQRVISDARRLSVHTGRRQSEQSLPADTSAAGDAETFKQDRPAFTD